MKQKVAVRIPGLVLGRTVVGAETVGTEAVEAWCMTADLGDGIGSAENAEGDFAPG
jgi:hypothetical protein